MPCRPRRRRPLPRLTALLLPALAVPLMASPAAAVPPTPDAATLAVIGSLNLTVRLIPGGFRACLSGSVTPSFHVAGAWTMVSAGVVGTTPLQRTWSTDAWTASHCEDVLRGSTLTGSLHFHAAYTAAGQYVVAEGVGGGTWDPVAGPQPYSVNPTR